MCRVWAWESTLCPGWSENSGLWTDELSSVTGLHNLDALLELRSLLSAWRSLRGQRVTFSFQGVRKFRHSQTRREERVRWHFLIVFFPALTGENTLFLAGHCSDSFQGRRVRLLRGGCQNIHPALAFHRCPLAPTLGVGSRSVLWTEEAKQLMSGAEQLGTSRGPQGPFRCPFTDWTS